MFTPRYFKNFVCTADKCTHSCCIGWEIDIDEDTLAYYQSLPAPLCKKILKTIQITAEGAHFALGKDKRCKNLDKRGLCRIHKALGHEGLCDICREHPRFYHDTDREEVGLGAACEAAAALILASDGYTDFVCIDGDAAPIPLATDFNPRAEREALYTLLADRTRPLSARLADLAARYGGAKVLPLNKLEYLEEAHRALFQNALGAHAQGATSDAVYERFFAYLIYRHASTTKTAAEFSRAVRMALSLLPLFRGLITAEGLSPVRAAVTISEEIEYSEDNTTLLLQEMA